MMEVIYYFESWVEFTRLHGVVSQKIEYSIAVALRNSNPTYVLNSQ
jgi:hypothetical protein